MSIDRRKAALFGTAAAVRVLLFVTFPSLPDLLTGRVEISTPVTSFKRCKIQPRCRRYEGSFTDKHIVQEGLFLYNHNVSPYDGGVYHQAPFLLTLFSLLPSSADYPLVTNLLYILVDLLSANALMQIADSGESGSSKLFTSPRKEKRWDSYAIATAYASSRTKT